VSIHKGHKFTEKHGLVLFVVIAWLLSACNMPGQPSTTPSDEAFLATQVAENIAAGLTQAARQTPSAEITTTGQAAETSAPTATGSPPPTVTHTSPPPTYTPAPCDRMQFVNDMTYPDNTEVPSGEIFVKTWRLLNAGSCTWTPNYAMVFSGGDPMGAPTSIQLPGYAEPGQTIDISVTLRAPNAIGTYRGDYKLRNPSGVVFGIGAEDKPFYVQIKIAAATGTLFDFITQAASADWESGTGGAPDTTLTFDGADDDANGVAKLKDGVKLENGSTSGKVLLTYPKRQDDGFVSGTYSSYTVQDGDHFKARLGFLLTDTSCGGGKVKFRLNYLESGTLTTMQDWVKTCNGNLIDVDVDLSSLKGRTVQFMLAVLASGDSSDDWAVWSSPRIEHP
jgi:hypothetical protein